MKRKMRKMHQFFHKTCLLALALLFVLPSIAAAEPPAIPWGGINNPNLDYPDYLREYHDKKFEATGFDFSFLPRITNGKSSSALGEKAYQSTQDELIGFIASLSTKNLRWKIVGEFPSYGKAEGDASVSDGSFKLPILVFSDPAVFSPSELKALKKPVIWLQGQIHGGESAGGDAMLVLAKRLAEGDLNYLLEKISVIIVPRYNVDGAWRNQRGTNSYRYRINIDQNRDNQGFESAITRTMHRLVNEYEPFFFGDAHEQGFTLGTGYVDGNNTRLTIDWMGNDVSTLIAPIYNHPEALKKYVSEVFEPAYHKNIEDRGLNWAWYIQTSTTPPGETPGRVVGLRDFIPADVRARSGDEVVLVKAADGGAKYVPLQTFDGAIDTGITDPSFGLKGACSILTEASTPAIGINLGLRIAGHVATYESVMKTAYERADEFYDTVIKARADMAARGEKVAEDNKLVLTIHYPETPVQHNIPTLTAVQNEKTKEWSLKEGVFESKMFLSRDGTPNVSVVQPRAYIIKANDATIARLAHSGVVFERLNNESEIEVEAYTVKAADAYVGDTYVVPSGMYGWTDAKVITEVSTSKKKVKFPKDTYVMYMDQVRATHAAYALEPLSLRNYGNYYLCMKTDMPTMGGDPVAEGFFKAEVGDEYPVYRYMGEEKLDTYSIGQLTAPFATENSMVEWVLPYDKAEKDEIADELGMDVLCISKAWMWLKGKDFTAMMPDSAGDVDLTGAQWFAYNWKEKSYEKLEPEEDGDYKIKDSYIDSGNNVKLVAAADKAPSGGGSSGCNAGSFGLLPLLVFSLGLFAVKNKKR